MIWLNSKGFRHCIKSAIATAVVFTLVVASWVLTWAAAEESPAAEKAAISADTEMVTSRKNKKDVGLRGHGFVRDGDVFTTIDAPGAGLFTLSFGIDESGKTVGGYVDERGRLHGFLKDKEAFTVIDFPGAAATLVSRINAQEQIVGAYSKEGNTPAFALPHGFLLQDGAFTRIDFPGARRTQPFGINDRGQIAGGYFDAEGVSQSFLLDNGTFSTIDLPGAVATAPLGINNRGQIVGSYLDVEGVTHGFLREKDGDFTVIDLPGASATLPFGINDRGRIVGISLLP